MTQAEYYALSYYDQRLFERNPAGFEYVRGKPLPDADLQYAIDLLGHIPNPATSQWERILAQLMYDCLNYMADTAIPQATYIFDPWASVGGAG